jgi:hypothetical protein
VSFRSRRRMVRRGGSDPAMCFGWKIPLRARVILLSWPASPGSPCSSGEACTKPSRRDMTRPLLHRRTTPLKWLAILGCNRSRFRPCFIGNIGTGVPWVAVSVHWRRLRRTRREGWAIADQGSSRGLDRQGSGFNEGCWKCCRCPITGLAVVAVARHRD